MIRTLSSSSLAIAAVLALGAGCADRTYITPSHGRAYHESFARQHANPPPSRREGRALNGLDSQEAAAVSQTYRHNLSRQSDASGTQPQMVQTNPQAAPPQPYIPPPSVP